MMKTLIFGLAIAAVLAGGVYGGDSVAGAGGSFVDPRDNQTYRTVRIGNLTWMAENLNYQTDNSWCYDDDPSYCQTYGRLYTWNAAMSSCPAGWRLPSDADWDDLMIAVGGVRRDMGNDVVVWEGTGTKLKSKTGWATEGSGGNYIFGTDNFNFSALPGGYRWSIGGFSHADFYGFWWSATENGAIGVRNRSMTFFSANVRTYWLNKDFAISVRCVRD